jgi:hypothetical protein
MANPPLVYHYHHDTGVYLNASSAADPDPMDEGKWLYPADTTTKIPPSVPDPKKQHAVFANGSWAVQAIPPPPKPTHAENVKNAPKTKLVVGPTIADVLMGENVDRGL